VFSQGDCWLAECFLCRQRLPGQAGNFLSNLSLPVLYPSPLVTFRPMVVFRSLAPALHWIVFRQLVASDPLVAGDEGS